MSEAGRRGLEIHDSKDLVAAGRGGAARGGLKILPRSASLTDGTDFSTPQV
jgi:hypothetical protein